MIIGGFSEGKEFVPVFHLFYFGFRSKKERYGIFFVRAWLSRCMRDNSLDFMGEAHG